MRNLKQNFIFFILFLSILSCENVNSENANRNNNSDEIVEFLEKIKKQTADDILKLGIKKVLLRKNGEWGSPIQGDFDFKENGIVFHRYKGKKMKQFYWKVENNKLYINPNNNPSIGPYLKNKNIFVATTIEATRPNMYSNIEDIKKYKYSMIIKTEDNKNYLLFIEQLK